MSRTPSTRAHKDVLDAVIALLADRGIDGTSMDAIAWKAGVSKATIYNHWEDKEALLLAAMADLHGLHARPAFDSGNTRADIAAVLSHRPPPRWAELQERIAPHFIAYSARNPEFSKAWRNMVMEPPRQELRRLLQQGIAKGELDPRLDTESALVLMLGPLLYAHVFLKDGPAAPKSLPELVVDTFWKAYGLRRKRSSARS